MRTQVMVLQTFVFNTILLANFDFNHTSQDFFARGTGPSKTSMILEIIYKSLYYNLYYRTPSNLAPFLPWMILCKYTTLILSELSCFRSNSLPESTRKAAVLQYPALSKEHIPHRQTASLL